MYEWFLSVLRSVERSNNVSECTLGQQTLKFLSFVLYFFFWEECFNGTIVK